jgi:hypothetical protein
MPRAGSSGRRSCTSGHAAEAADLNVQLTLLIGFLVGFGVGLAARSWWALAITILVPILIFPGSIVSWLTGVVPYPLLTAGVITAVVASTGCASGVFIGSNPIGRRGE